MKKILAGLCLILIISIFSCKEAASKGVDTPITNKEASDTSTVLYYGNGVYYFYSTNKEFGVALSSFLSDSSKQVLSVTGDGTDSYGEDRGYWVVITK